MAETVNQQTKQIEGIVSEFTTLREHHPTSQAKTDVFEAKVDNQSDRLLSLEQQISGLWTMMTELKSTTINMQCNSVLDEELVFEDEAIIDSEMELPLDRYQSCENELP